ncbi:MAG TPA: response regulator [Candidatus Omnitrophota bacterium]|nr:response regulator [Candidatus Omnitrophota bacterium]HQJ15076.1 response regulator [Candidatus Omnitrophota bacterium]
MQRILVVDDALFMRRMISQILEEHGYLICGQAANATEAVEKYKECRPDLVTMDIVMPKMDELDGIGAVRQIIRHDPKARILICSVIGQQSLVVEAIRAGALDFVIKPVQPQRLLDAVAKALGA